MNKLINALLMVLCTFVLNAYSLTASAQTTAEIAKNNCDSCANFAAKTLNYCVTKKGNYGKAAMTNALKDVITSCKSSSEFLANASALQKKSAAIAVEACNECIKACGGSTVNSDVQIKACADECRKCAANLSKIANSQ
ncbi:hypothetical protein BH11CYA1_BH11CYA1_26040 [soil metagenome]